MREVTNSVRKAKEMHIFLLRHFNLLICIILEEAGWWEALLVELEDFFFLIEVPKAVKFDSSFLLISKFVMDVS